MVFHMVSRRVGLAQQIRIRDFFVAVYLLNAYLLFLAFLRFFALPLLLSLVSIL